MFPGLETMGPLIVSCEGVVRKQSGQGMGYMETSDTTANAQAVSSPNLTKLLLRAGLLFWSLSAFATPPPSGVAPVIAPAGGFAIDGDLVANTPAANIGDWLASTNGTGGGVLTAAGVPLDPTRTFH